MKPIAFVGVALAFAAALAIWIVIWIMKNPDLPDVELDRATSYPIPTRPSPFDIVEQNSDDSVVAGETPIVAIEPDLTIDALSTTRFVDWHSARSEDELRELVDSISADPALLQLLMDAYRQELDPLRRQSLASILGLVGGEQVTELASELIYSGDAAQRAEGMDLLQSVQPGNAIARDIVSGILATEVEPDVLIDALTALAKPGSVDAQSRAQLSDQVSRLATHDSEDVRGISLGILSRWADGVAYTDVFVSALDDTSRHVRTAAVYALHDHVENQELVVDRLFSVLRNTDEHLRVRSAALLSLKSQTLTPAQLLELERLEIELTRRPSRK